MMRKSSLLSSVALKKLHWAAISDTALCLLAVLLLLTLLPEIETLIDFEISSSFTPSRTLLTMHALLEEILCKLNNW